jgi:hypothetical protein
MLVDSVESGLFAAELLTCCQQCDSDLQSMGNAILGAGLNMENHIHISPNVALLQQSVVYLFSTGLNWTYWHCQWQELCAPDGKYMACSNHLVTHSG